MRYSAALWLLLVLGCASGTLADRPTRVMAPAPPPRAEGVLTGVFGACGPDCTFDFRELDAPSPRVTTTYCRDYTPSCISFEGVLTHAAIAKLKKLGTTLAQAKLEPHYGCGKCVDGTDNTVIVVHDDGHTSSHSYDTMYPEAPELIEAHATLKWISSALYRCQSNELIRFGNKCTPYDKVWPRPYSRP